VYLLIKYFGLAFSALLPVINPLGSALVFLSLVGNAPASVYRSLARKIAITTTLFLIAVELVGTLLLAFFGISLPVMQVSGGLVLATMGWRLLTQEEPQPKPQQGEVDETTYAGLQQQVFYPFTFPVTADPGSVVVMITLSAHASAKGVFPNIMAHVGILLAAVVISVTVLFSYAYAPRITARISPKTVHGIRRVIAFVLLCIGVQITWNGVDAMLKTVLKG